MKSNPAAYDHKLVQVTAFASRGFENFTLFDPACQAWPEIWLEYGGLVSSGTVYSSSMSANRKRSKPIEIEGITVPLTDDKAFRDFDRLIQRPPESIAHAILAGWFFAGSHGAAAGSSAYGPMGCCSLLIVQQVLEVDPQNRTDVDFHSAPDQPTAGKDGCEVRIVLEGAPTSKIAAQREAEAGPRAWSMDDPVRVASDALIGLLNLAPETAINLSLSRKLPGRSIFEWKAGGKKETYTVVVHRPYWLSFYAKDPRKLAWVAMAVYQSSCQ